MLAKFRSAVSKSRRRRREAERHRARRRPLRGEPLEGRLLLSADSWVVNTHIPGSPHIAVAADNEGNVYVGTGAWGNDGSTNSNDIFLTKYTSEGSLAWEHDILLRFPGLQQVTDVAVGVDGVYIVGYFEGTVNFDPKELDGTAVLTSVGGQDAYLAKYSTEGDFLWARQWGGEGTDWLRGIAVSGDCVFVTGNTEVPVRKKVQSNHFVASVSSDNVPRWEKTLGGPIFYSPSDIAVFSPSDNPTNVYVIGKGESGGYVKRLTETVDGQDAELSWTYDLGENKSMAGWGGLALGDGNPLPSLYVLTQGSGQALLKINDTGGSGEFAWSAPMAAYPWGVTFDGTTDTVYVAGYFREQEDISGTLLTSRGVTDGFLARYNTDGELLAAQRMGGSFADTCYSVAVSNDRAYVGAKLLSTDGDFPAGEPGAMSAFVPGEPPTEVYVMQLDTAAPIVQTAETDITVAEGTTSVTLSATTSAGKIVWYEGGVAVTDPALDTPVFTFTPTGTHQISAIATDTAGRIGMAGVVVTVAPPATLSIDDVSQDEGRRGTTNFTFTVTRSGDTSDTVTVDYDTVDGTATAGEDYNTASGTLSFAAGETTKTITVGVKGDRTAEDPETFFVSLSNAFRATIEDGEGVGTIVNDDGTPLMAGFAEQGTAGALTAAQLQQMTPLALAVWSGWAQMTVPDDLRFELDDLPSGQLGEAFRHTITLDANANGAGWYLYGDTPRAGQVDLLTVLAHEIGHVLGYGHSDLEGDVMSATLLADTRRLPGSTPVTMMVPRESVLAAPVLAADHRLDAVHRDLVDHPLLANGLERNAGADSDSWMLPLVTADYAAQPQRTSHTVRAQVVKTIADEETELLDDELLDLITAGKP